VSDLTKLYDRAKDISDRMDALQEDLGQITFDLDRAPEVAAIRFLVHATMPESFSQVDEEPLDVGAIVLVTGHGRHGGVYVRSPSVSEHTWLGPLGVPGEDIGWHDWQDVSQSQSAWVLYPPQPR
jgi:hypothetical protein